MELPQLRLSSTSPIPTVLFFSSLFSVTISLLRQMYEIEFLLCAKQHSALRLQYWARQKHLLLGLLGLLSSSKGQTWIKQMHKYWPLKSQPCRSWVDPLSSPWPWSPGTHPSQGVSPCFAQDLACAKPKSASNKHQMKTAEVMVYRGHQRRSSSVNYSKYWQQGFTLLSFEKTIPR